MIMKAETEYSIMSWLVGIGLAVLTFIVIVEPQVLLTALKALR